MELTHIAVWTNDLERLRNFYVTWFHGKSKEKYVNPRKGFASYFITFENGVALEIMQRIDITDSLPGRDYIGLSHFAFSLGTKEKVDEMIERFRKAGYRITGEPRMTGDGFYEGVFLDPDGNLIEVVA